MYIEKEGEALKQAGGEGTPWKVDRDGDTRVTPSWTGSAGAVQRCPGMRGSVPKLPALGF